LETQSRDSFNSAAATQSDNVDSSANQNNSLTTEQGQFRVGDGQQPGDFENFDPQKMCEAYDGSLDSNDSENNIHTVDVDPFTGSSKVGDRGGQLFVDDKLDNPEFQRVGVTRASDYIRDFSRNTETGDLIRGELSYWLVNSDQTQKEQYVRYRPNFRRLGVGWYKITMSYRSLSSQRNLAQVEVRSRDHNEEALRISFLQLGKGETRTRSFRNSDGSLFFFLCQNSEVIVREAAAASALTFGPMTFEFFGANRP